MNRDKQNKTTRKSEYQLQRECSKYIYNYVVSSFTKYPVKSQIPYAKPIIVSTYSKSKFKIPSKPWLTIALAL